MEVSGGGLKKSRTPVFDASITSSIFSLIFVDLFLLSGFGLSLLTEQFGKSADFVYEIYFYGHFACSAMAVILLISFHKLDYSVNYLAIVPFFVVAALSILNTVNVNASYSYIVRALFFAIEIAMFSLVFGPRYFVAIIAGYLITANIASFITVLAFPHVGIHAAENGAGKDLIGCWRGVYLEKNILGRVANYGLLVLVLFARLLPWDRRISYAIAGVCLLNMVFARSGTNMVFFTVSVVFFVLMLRRKLTRTQLILNGVMLIVMSGLSYFAVDWTLHVLGKDTSFTGRTDIWAFCWRYITERPFLGYGIGTSVGYLQEQMRKEIFASAVDAHNAYLQVVLDVGFIGGAALIFAIGMAFVRGLFLWRDRSYEADHANRALLILLFVGSGVALTEVGPFWVYSDLGPITFGAIVAIGTLKRGMRGRAAGRSPFEVFKTAA